MAGEWRAGARSSRIGLAAVVVGMALGLWSAVASAHVERPSYWPDPAPDCSITPCAGGKVPAARSLFTALDRSKPGATHVVCQDDSMQRLRAAVRKAETDGYQLRPSQPAITISKKRGRRLVAFNQRLARHCRSHSIQDAVNLAGNDDRVVIMPGLYTEPKSRSAPTHDPKCEQYTVHSDSGDPGALSHEYQIHCPNDANLVAVIGRGEGPGKTPDPPREDRHGIPNLGPCIRCNLQIEGSGPSPDDVVIEAGDPKAGNGGPSAAGHAKDVGVFVDQADGFVLRNVTVRHATEHDIYILESDGYLFDRFKTFYAGGYGVLTFVEDHGLMQNCEAAGNGDSGLYPGAGAKTSAGRDTSFYPKFRYSQEIRWCDSHHNDGGYSGTDGNATHLHHNDFYDNALGFTTDVFTASGHPGFPQQGDLIEDNNFYSNNFNPFVEGSDVKPSIPAPVGTGLWIAGGNDNVIRNNRFWDNRRRGIMLFSAPDATVCGPVTGDQVTGCSPTKVSTSYDNLFYGNLMGVAPDGSVQPNGTDFWWDSFPGNTGNCWWGNRPAPGRSITTSPLLLPDCANGTNPSLSIGTGAPLNEAELLGCVAGFEVSGYPNGNATLCDWTKTPPKPGSTKARSAQLVEHGLRVRQADALRAYCSQVTANRTCAAVVGDAGAPSLMPALPQTAQPPAHPRKALSLYTCRDWRRGGSAFKTAIVARLRHWVGLPVEGDRLVGYGSVLDDDLARAFFDQRCSRSYARKFVLYKQYGQAAGFAGIAP